MSGDIHLSPNSHIAWLTCLYVLLQKIRREGLMSIEGDIEAPDSTASIFQHFPQTLAHHYIDFATDVLRLMVGGNLNADENQVYVDHYIAGLMEKSSVFSRSSVDESLLKTIWLPLWGAMKGYAPQIACEFGRQAVPLKIKLSFVELEDMLRGINRQFNRSDMKTREGGLDAAVDKFIASLG